MPRELSEAMLTGVIPVTLRNADTELLIKNGVNGFCGDSVEELVEHLRWLARHERQRRTISRSARLSAMDLLNVDRCIADWLHLIRRL
jgi:glycosyltransferase involved in cell wall biosynthesis